MKPLYTWAVTSQLTRSLPDVTWQALNMGRCCTCVLLSSLVMVAGIAVLLNVNIPQGFQDTNKLRVLSALLKLNRIVGQVQHTLYGYDATIVSIRERMNSISMGEVDTIGLEVHPRLVVDYVMGVGYQITDDWFAGVEVRIYRPLGVTVPAPVIFYMHGGGFILGDIKADLVHLPLVHLSRQAQMTVVSVNYRLAPEHPFPTPLNDCLTAYKYLVEHAVEYGVDTSRIAVQGDSAGGNLAATLSLYLRDIGYKPTPKLQVLLYPVTQSIDLQTPSYQQNKDDPLLQPLDAARFFSLHAFGNSSDSQTILTNMHTSPEVKAKYAASYINHQRVLPEVIPPYYTAPRTDFGNETFWESIKDVFLNPYFSPLLADDLSGLPQAFVFTCEQDILRDDGILYAQRLQAVGNKVTHVNVPAPHGIASFISSTDFFTAMETITQYIQQEL